MYRKYFIDISNPRWMGIFFFYFNYAKHLKQVSKPSKHVLKSFAELMDSVETGRQLFPDTSRF